MKQLSLGILASLLLSSSSFSATLSKNIQDSSLVVYNGGIGLVHEKRSLSVNKNDTQIVYEGVANTIDTDSVNIKLTDAITLKSQQYRFDKLTLQKLLDAHIGKTIEVQIKGKSSTKKINAILLSHSTNTALVKTANSKILSTKTKDIIFKNIPKELITKPSLVWNIQTNRTLNTDLEIDYLINKISWKSDYILNLSDNTAHLNGWISIDNRSGKSFQDTRLNVLAGDINLERTQVYRSNKVYASPMADSEQIIEQSHEGYHLYSVPTKVNLLNNEKTQIKFIDKSDIEIQRRYSAYLSNPHYVHGENKNDVTQYIDISGLDIALPKGVVRIYSKLDEQNILLAQTRLKHTPKNEPIQLKVGTNFDLKVKQTLVEKDDDKYRNNTTIQYTITNSSAEIKTVELLVPFNAHKDSKIRTTIPYTFKKGNLVAYLVKVYPQNSQTFKANYISKK